MEMLMDYHLLFIVIAIVLLIGGFLALPFVGIDPGTTINTLTNLGIGIGAIFIGLEAVL